MRRCGPTACRPYADGPRPADRRSSARCADRLPPGVHRAVRWHDVGGLFGSDVRVAEPAHSRRHQVVSPDPSSAAARFRGLGPRAASSARRCTQRAAQLYKRPSAKPELRVVRYLETVPPCTRAAPEMPVPRSVAIEGAPSTAAVRIGRPPAGAAAATAPGSLGVTSHTIRAPWARGISAAGSSGIARNSAAHNVQIS